MTAVAVLLLNLILIGYEWKRESLAVLFWAPTLVFFALPHWVHAQGTEVPAWVIDEASYFALIFMGLYLVARILYHARLGTDLRRRAHSFALSQIREADPLFVDLLYTLYTLAFLFRALCFYRRGGSILIARAYQDVVMGFPEYVAGILLMSLAAVVFIAFIRRQYVAMLIFALMYLFFYQTTQIRYYLLPFFVPFLVYFLFHPNRRKQMLGMGLGLLFIFLVYLVQQMRWVGNIATLAETPRMEIFQNTLRYMRSGDGEFGLIKAFYYFLEKQNHLRDFGEGLGFLRLALLFLPASIAPFKPRDFAIDMYREWFHVDNPKGTMHPTAFGDAYANFGFWGAGLGLLYALWVSLVDESVRRTKDPLVRTIKISLAVTMFIILARGAVYNAIANFILGWALLLAVQILYAIIRYKQKPFRTVARSGGHHGSVL